MAASNGGKPNASRKSGSTQLLMCRESNATRERSISTAGERGAWAKVDISGIAEGRGAGDVILAMTGPGKVQEAGRIGKGGGTVATTKGARPVVSRTVEAAPVRSISVVKAAPERRISEDRRSQPTSAMASRTYRTYTAIDENSNMAVANYRKFTVQTVQGSARVDGREGDRRG